MVPFNFVKRNNTNWFLFELMISENSLVQGIKIHVDNLEYERQWVHQDIF